MTSFPKLRWFLVSFICIHLPYAAFAGPPPGSAPVMALTSGRLLGATSTLISLLCLLAGGSASWRGSRSVAMAAGWGGAVGLGLGAIVVARADQGLGSGQGLAGGVVGLVLGATSVVVAALAARRSSPR